MRVLLMGFSGWARAEAPRSESLRVVDTALTVVGTLLVAVTWALLQK